MAPTTSKTRSRPVRNPPKRNANHATNNTDQVITPMNKYMMKISDLRGKRYFRAGMFRKPSPQRLPKIRFSAHDRSFLQPKCSEDFANIIANHFKVERKARTDPKTAHRNIWKSPFVTIWNTRVKAEKFELNKWFKELELKGDGKDTSDEWKSCRMLGNILAEKGVVVFDANDLREQFVAEGIWSDDTVNEDETDGCFLVWKIISRKAVESSQRISNRRQRDLCIEMGFRQRYGPWKRGIARKQLLESSDEESEEDEDELEDGDQGLDEDSDEDLGGDLDEDSDEQLDLDDHDQDDNEDIDEDHDQDSNKDSDKDGDRDDDDDGDAPAEESDSEWSWVSNTAPDIRARRSYSKPKIDTVEEESNSNSNSQENKFYKGYGFWEIKKIVDWRWMTDDFGEFVPTNNGRWRWDYLVKWKGQQYRGLESWQPDWDLTVKAIEDYWRQFDGERPKDPNQPAR